MTRRPAGPAQLDRRLKVGEGQTPPREDWNRRGRRGDFLPRFATWRWPGIDVPSLVEASGEIFEFPMVDRDPLPRWTFGRTTLIGDAAHPMYPIGSNGATQGIIDARALAGCLRADHDVVAALEHYESTRLRRPRRSWKRTRGLETEVPMQLVHEPRRTASTTSMR